MTRLDELEAKMQYSHNIAVEAVEDENDVSKASWYVAAYINPENPKAFKDKAEVEEYMELNRKALGFGF